MNIFSIDERDVGVCLVGLVPLWTISPWHRKETARWSQLFKPFTGIWRLPWAQVDFLQSDLSHEYTTISSREIKKRNWHGYKVTDLISRVYYHQRCTKRCSQKFNGWPDPPASKKSFHSWRPCRWRWQWLDSVLTWYEQQNEFTQDGLETAQISVATF